MPISDALPLQVARPASRPRLQSRGRRRRPIIRQCAAELLMISQNVPNPFKGGGQLLDGSQGRVDQTVPYQFGEHTA